MEAATEGPMVESNEVLCIEGVGDHWVVDLSSWIGCFAHIETTDGSVREGKVTDIIWKRLDINGVEHGLPKAIELNGDPIDQIEVAHIQRMQLR